MAVDVAILRICGWATPHARLAHLVIGPTKPKLRVDRSTPRHGALP